MLAFVSFSFLTPLAALVGLVAIVPLAAFGLARRRVKRVRTILELPEPPRAGRRMLAAGGAVLLLALAAAQPAITSGTRVRVRKDAAALFVFDTSRSMLAAAGPHKPTRLVRAIAAAKHLRSAIPDVPVGIATFTDRVVPNLLPVADETTFDATLDQAIGIEQPGPLEQQIVRSTTFDALTQIPGGDYFQPQVRHRVAVLFTDGETRPFNSAVVARAFQGPPATSFIAVRFWHSNEAVYKAGGRVEAKYVPDPTSRDLLDAVAIATRGKMFPENRLGGAITALRTMLGTGPASDIARPTRMHPLAPWLVAAALLPLALVFSGALPVPRGPVAVRSVKLRSSAEEPVDVGP